MFKIFFILVNKYYRYNLDYEPAEYGISAGYYAPSKKGYVGIGNWQFVAFNSGRIQLDPPGIIFNNLGGPGTFLNDSHQIWYLYKNPRHEYKWVDAQNDEVVPYVIDFSTEVSGYASYFARYKKNNRTIKNTRTGYQVLTCRTKKNETKIPMPKVPTAPPSMMNTVPSCDNKWLPYNNDNAPAQNGISAGLFDCENPAYVGKRETLGIVLPGRIQTTSPSSFYTISAGKESFMSNGSFYLADNPNYSYYWVPCSGEIPSNVVLINQPVGLLSMGISRVKVNGKMLIERFLLPVSQSPGTDGMLTSYYDFEILVCDPWPKYKCAQQWKKLNANDSNLSIDGFNVDGTSFIGRSIQKCMNGCDYGLGKIQSNSTGVNYLDDLTTNAIFDNSSNVEYLVKNSSYTYKWQPSRNGVKVVNALELQKEGHRPFYIGMTRINDKVLVGKVRPGEGLFFIDQVNGKQQSISSYEVLTCTSPDVSNDEDEEEKDVNWFSSFGCPIRRQWSFTKWRCVCLDEFRGLFAFSGAKWNEETCSYI
ncbi:hypothetical protein PVAND_002295 [Polypedilum vanderplanki]|uniref:Uncharacterized protein n=1 Tax=Polypedilum vanderplanki TaxID=319348 RepID=A0A9J6BR56_POLVA|nr:hypothetical protein PVAND_002295 [Polypedilum vanderplanki]